jgi:prepilin-type N-terminal cleavage/methylation domain-containing protein
MRKLNTIKVQSGFTLIELMVVIAIIALMSSIVLVSISHARENTRNTKRVSDMTQFQKAMDLYYSNNNTYPTVSAGVALSSFDSTILVPKYLMKMPATVVPADGGCSVGPGQSTNDYYMMPNVAGTQYFTSTFTITFCISTQTGTLGPGQHTVTNLGFQ